MTPKKIGKDVKALSNEITRYIRTNINDSNEEQYTMIQFFFMNYIGRFSKTSSVFQRDLESEFNIRRSTATGILQVLEKNHLIIRQTSAQDARLKEIILTTEGQAVFESRRKKLDALDTQLINGIKQTDLDIFYAVMNQIYVNIDCEETRKILD